VTSVPCTRLDLGLSTGPSGFLRLPSAARFLLRFHPPASFPPPTECCDTRPAPRAPNSLATIRKPQSASLGVPSLIAASTSGVHICPGYHSRALVRPRRFSRPRRFAPPPALRVCFTPLPRPGFALQGFVPLTEPYRVSPADSCPLDVERNHLRFDPRQRSRPRLQGFAPRESAVPNQSS